MAIEEGVNIPIWLNTACDPSASLAEVVNNASKFGYQGLEVMAFREDGGDRAGKKDFTLCQNPRCIKK